ncbi:SBBP repeat-containing protein [Desulfoscipio sp. XC116]|uniref:SBBP repeat-containing protein n=1 Tax=Desulfoscipio sp. XC116 TaxID=3144975 RepID=UPI00325BEC38
MRNFLKMGQVLLSALVIIGVSLSCAAIGEAGDSDAAIAGTGIEAEKNTNNRAEDYDRSRPLVTDPLLDYTSISGSKNDCAMSLAVNSAGNVYVAGYTHSADFPATAEAYDTSLDDEEYERDAFVTKLDADLSTLLAATFISAASSFATDSAANVYVAGMTSSDDFPHNDAFVSKLDPGLNALLASTGIGGSNEGSGSGENHAHSIAMDSAGNVYIAGSAYYLGHGVISEDVFVSKFAGGL